MLLALLACFVGMGGFMHKVLGDFRVEMRSIQDISDKDTSTKLKRQYDRFDEFKEHIEGTHTRKEVCLVIHDQLKDELKEIKSDVKEILKKVKFNGNAT